MSFNDDMERLKAIMEQIEGNELDMEASLALFEEGVKLIRDCRTYLEGAKRRVTILTSEQEVESGLADGQ